MGRSSSRLLIRGRRLSSASQTYPISIETTAEAPQVVLSKRLPQPLSVQPKSVRAVGMPRSSVSTYYAALGDTSQVRTAEVAGLKLGA
jgi:hypothetical protein